MNSNTKYREYWLDLGYYTITFPYDSQEQKDGCDVHVIEYSALTDLEFEIKAEITKLKKANNVLRDALKYVENKDLDMNNEVALCSCILKANKALASVDKILKGEL